MPKRDITYIYRPIHYPPLLGERTDGPVRDLVGVEHRGLHLVHGQLEALLGHGCRGARVCVLCTCKCVMSDDDGGMYGGFDLWGTVGGRSQGKARQGKARQEPLPPPIMYVYKKWTPTLRCALHAPSRSASYSHWWKLEMPNALAFRFCLISLKALAMASTSCCVVGFLWGGD